MKTLIPGYGNPGRQDDSLGAAFVDAGMTTEEPFKFSELQPSAVKKMENARVFAAIFIRDNQDIEDG